ncbi:MAG TPA: hypothetical protein VK892_14940 [Pyrinomonadaceae bacterium]|nr:hypothetical protein [Pyrinomonadaceae bacterium]
MYKSVSFNIFDLGLQDIVYKENSGKDKQRLDKSRMEKRHENLDNSIRKPNADSREKFLDSDKNRALSE